MDVDLVTKAHEEDLSAVFQCDLSPDKHIAKIKGETYIL